jgi:hypothetical protein
VLAEPLPNNDGNTNIDTQTDGRDLGSTPLRWAHLPYMSFFIKAFKSYWEGDSQTHRQPGDFISLL